MADLNDLIAGGIRAPQVQDLGEAMNDAQTKRLTLGGLMQRQQLGDQQLATGKLVLEQQQRDAADEQAVNDALAQHTSTVNGVTKVDRPAVIGALTTAGKGNAAAKVQANFTAQDNSAAKLAEAQSAAQTAALTLTSHRATELARLAQAVEDAPAEGKQAAYTNLHTEGLRLGLISPQDQAQFQPIYDPSMDPHLKALTLGATDAKTRSEMALQQAQIDKDKGEVDDANKKRAENWRVQAATIASTSTSQQQLDANRAQLAANGAPPAALAAIPATWTPEAMSTLRRSALTAEQQTQADATAATLAETKSRDAATEANNKRAREQADQRNQIAAAAADPFGALGLNKMAPPAANSHGAEFLGTLPAPMSARVKAIADGREAPITGIGAAKGEGAALMSAVEQYDPTWTAQRAQVRKSFTTGPDGRNIGNLNTAPVHLEQLAAAAQAMQNNAFVPGNQLWNSVSTMLGGTAPTNFEAMKTVVAGEMASAMKGNATDPEIASFNASVKSANSPAQLAGVIGKVFIPALGAKLQTYNERYHAQMPDDPWSPVLPSARAVFTRYGADPATAPPAVNQNPYRR